MKQILLTMIILIMTFFYMTAQNKEAVKGISPNDEMDEVPTYKLKVNNKVNTFFTTKLTETTKVNRLYPDSTSKEYERNIIYYMTTKIEESPQDGFQTVIVTVDSLEYKFVEGDAVFEFNTQDMSGSSLKFKDLNQITPPLGREFKLIYSPYGEVAKISGEDIDETMTYLQSGKDVLSPSEMFIWTNGLSYEHLSYLSDMQKIIFSPIPTAIDSIWYSPLNIELNGYGFKDTLAVKIADYNAGDYTIIGYSQALKPLPKEYLAYNIPNMVNVTEVSGEGLFNMELKASGRIISTGTQFKVKAKIKVGEQFIIEEINSNSKWDFINLYKL